jgi:hypothetical protein
VKRHQRLNLSSSRPNVFATFGVALIAIAMGLGGTTYSHQARADTNPNGTMSAKGVMVLPTLHVAASDTTATDATPGRERVRERTHDHMNTDAKERRVVDKHLTNDQVRDIVAGHIAMSGNPNIKVGKVAAKGEGAVAVEIVTKSGALVETRDISTKTGLPVKMEKAMTEHRRHGRGGRDEFRGNDHKRDLALTVEQAKKLAEARIIMMGNPNLKVGAVKEKDADTISVDIVASDNSLVSQHLIDRHTGRRKRA